MSKPGYAWLLLLGAVSSILQACTILSAQRDRTRFFVLTPTVEASTRAGSASGLAREIAIGVGPVSFPAYLNRREFVTRVGADQLALAEGSRWAEPLDANFDNALAADLGRILGTQRVSIFPWYGTPQIDYQIEVRVHRFETGPGERSQIEASWVIEDGRNGKDLYASQTQSGSAVNGGESGGAAALSQDVGTLARAIAERIVILEENRRSGADAESKK